MRFLMINCCMRIEFSKSYFSEMFSLNKRKLHKRCEIKNIEKQITKDIRVDGDIVKKTVVNPTMLDVDILKYFIKRYNEFMPYNFKLIIMDNDYAFTILFTHIFLNRSLKQWFVPKEKLFFNTKKLLNDYENDENTLVYKLKEMNPNIKIKVNMGSDRYTPRNYFTYNKEFYLFDIENFYLNFYNLNGKIISYENINFPYNIMKYKDGGRKRMNKFSYVF